MLRSKSALPRPRPPSSHPPLASHPFPSPSLLTQQLHHQSKKSSLLSADRTDFFRHAQDLKQKHRLQISKLKLQNQKLRHLQSQLSVSLTSLKKPKKSSLPLQTLDQNFWRRLHDKQKHHTASKKSILLNLQNILQELEDNKLGMTEESPLVKNIRVLENRLDQVMIKYNEAQSIRKTYEEIARRLKEERIKYDNELASIERTLKGKEHDYEELLLLAHDAMHAKELAQGELKKVEVRRGEVEELRGRYLKEKRGQLECRKFVGRSETAKEKKEERGGGGGWGAGVGGQQERGERPGGEHEEGGGTFQKQQLSDYEDAYRKLKEVTGVLDANEIIQKFKTQGITTSEFERQRAEYQHKIEHLRVEHEQLKHKLDSLKFKEQSSVPLVSEIATKKHDSYLAELSELTAQLAHVRGVREKGRVKQERLEKILIDIKAGTKHIGSTLEFYKVGGGGSTGYSGGGGGQGESEEQSLLAVIGHKMASIYRVVLGDPEYQKKEYRKVGEKIGGYFESLGSAVGISTLGALGKGEIRNVRMGLGEEESEDDDSDEGREWRGEDNKVDKGEKDKEKEGRGEGKERRRGEGGSGSMFGGPLGNNNGVYGANGINNNWMGNVLSNRKAK